MFYRIVMESTNSIEELTLPEQRLLFDAHDGSMDLNRIRYDQDCERYIIRFDGESSDVLLQTLGEMAADKDLNYTWYDAAILSQRIRKMREETLQSASQEWKGHSPTNT